MILRRLFGLALFAALLVLLGTDAARAQGSPYNLFGFGLPVRSANPVIEAMGGAGVVLGGDRTVSDLNPADYTWLNRARFDVGIRFEYTAAQFSGLTDQQHDIRLDGIVFGAPFWSAAQAAIALGYLPITNAGSEIIETNEVGTTTSVSKGGANMLFLGVGARPTNWLAVGARADIITGDVRHQDRIAFSSAEADSGEFERDYVFHGIRPTLGFELIGDSLSSGLGGIILGASYSFPTSLTSTRETKVTPINSTLDTTLSVGGVGSFPGFLTAGVSYRISHRFRTELDYALQNFSSSFLYSPTTISGDNTLRNGTRISFGIERLANVAGEYGTSFGTDKWALRVGFSYSQLPIDPAGTTGVTELALSAGVGVPISFESLLNITVVGGQHNPIVANSAPKETFVRLGASVSLSERWFVPTRRE